MRARQLTTARRQSAPRGELTIYIKTFTLALPILAVAGTGSVAAQTQRVILEMNGITATQLNAVVRGCDRANTLTDNQIDDLPDEVVVNRLRNCLGAHLGDNEVIALLRRAGRAFPTAGHAGEP